MAENPPVKGKSLRQLNLDQAGREWLDDLTIDRATGKA